MDSSERQDPYRLRVEFGESSKVVQYGEPARKVPSVARFRGQSFVGLELPCLTDSTPRQFGQALPYEAAVPSGSSICGNPGASYADPAVDAL